MIVSRSLWQQLLGAKKKNPTHTQKNTKAHEEIGSIGRLSLAQMNEVKTSAAAEQRARREDATGRATRVRGSLTVGDARVLHSASGAVRSAAGHL